MPGDQQSAVLVAVPAAEAAVGGHRARFDQGARRGVPAHVTVVFPFAPPADLTPPTVRALAAAVAAVPRFRATWETTGWFETDVLWLAPQPADRFRALTAAVVAAFPAFPPYGGAFAEVTPHLTVGHDAGAEVLREVETEVSTHLPISMYVTEASLWCGSDADGSWHQVATLPLG